jgi:hypothetical protein
LGIRASKPATTRMTPPQVLYGHRTRLSMVVEALIRNDTSEETSRFEAHDQRTKHMETIQNMALRNIERALGCVTQSSALRAIKRKSTTCPVQRDYVLVKSHLSAGLSQLREANV